jgi:hypothetical protein
VSDAGSSFARTDREILVEVRRDLRYVKEKVDKLDEHKADRLAVPTKTVDDHEKRIRVLENFRWWILGAVFSAAGLASAATRLIFR